MGVAGGLAGIEISEAGDEFALDAMELAQFDLHFAKLLLVGHGQFRGGLLGREQTLLAEEHAAQLGERKSGGLQLRDPAYALDRFSLVEAKTTLGTLGRTEQP